MSTYKCSFCKRHPETIQRLFSECTIVRPSWESVQAWILTQTGITVNLNKRMAKFGMIMDLKMHVFKLADYSHKILRVCFKSTEKPIKYNRR